MRVLKTNPILKLEGVGVGYDSPIGFNWVIRGFSLVLWPGDKVALLGPSGVGKSSIALAILGLLPENSRMEGKIYFEGKLLSDKRLQKIRGTEIGIVFQQPHAYLNPLMTVEQIVTEVLQVKKNLPKVVAIEKARKVLFEVGLDRDSFKKYPFQLSGGMAQRVAIAQTIALEPKLLIGDEITSSLDTDLRKEILKLVVKFIEKSNSAFLFISHDEEAVNYVGCKTIKIDSHKGQRY